MIDLAQNIQQSVLNLLPARRKKASDWISFNAVCCTHRGETADTRNRGGVRPNSDGSVSYHCFNCGFKTGFYPGRPLSFRFRRLLSWLGADENTVQRLSMEAMRLRELVPVAEHTAHEPEVEISFKPRPLPDPALSFEEWKSWMMLQEEDAPVPQQLIDAVEYVAGRGIDPLEYSFYVTDDTAYNLHRRVIIPFYWKHKLIGYTARGLDDSIKPKFHSSYEPNYVFNIDRQLPTAKFAVVVEGPFDAMAVNGVAVLSNEISETQADIIDSLGREIIVVPDFDHKPNKQGKMIWAGQALMERAIEYGWSVSFPVWREQYKDVSEAVQHLGRLFVLKSILEARESNPVKIRLRAKL
jgi:hypothetical protein